LPPQSKNATDSDVRRHFEHYGPLERVRVVRDKKNRSRGYAFLVYERERDMKGMKFSKQIRQVFITLDSRVQRSRRNSDIG
jgi:RNA recognition motif-containing protein